MGGYDKRRLEVLDPALSVWPSMRMTVSASRASGASWAESQANGLQVVQAETRAAGAGAAWPVRGLALSSSRNGLRGPAGALLTVHKAMRLPTLAHSQDRQLARTATETLTGPCRGRRM